MEIQCPSCDARYRVPLTAIGPKGRRVQCANCGEVWRAMQDSARPVEAAPPPTPAPAPAEAAPAAARPAAPAGGAATGASSFSERLARVRGTDPRDAPATAASAEDPPSAEAQPQFIRRRPAAEEGSGDPLRSALRGREDETGAQDVEPDEGDAQGASAPADGAVDKRNQQMAEIRRMLDDLKGSGDAGAATAAPVAAGAISPADRPGRQRAATPGEPAAAAPARDDFYDPLREKLLDPDVKTKRDGPDTETQRAGLMRKHQKRSRRRRVAEKTRRSRGGFYTGLSLMLMVGGLMSATYVYADRIAERLPGTRQALTEYVNTVDQGLAQVQGLVGHVRQRIDVVMEEMLAE
ncbi:MAG: zinc-ribbon domain-containing protein [Pseudomonadota bacterium]